MFLFVLTALADPQSPELHRFKDTDRRLVLHVESGAVNVRSDATVSAIEVRVSPESPCEIQRIPGSSAELEVRGCKADVQVIAPMGTTFRLDVGDADVALNTTGPLRLTVGNGDVTGTARGPVRVRVGTGDVHLDGLTEEPTIAVASGKTELTYAKGG